MVRFLPFALILMGALLIVAEAKSIAPSADQLQPPAASSPSNNVVIKSPPRIRKIGKHRSSAVSPSFSPSEAPVTKETMEKQSSSSYQEAGHHAPAQSEEILVTTPRRHRSFDRSVAGGGVILGGLATTFFVAVICYIRATRRTVAAESAADHQPASAHQV